MLWRDKTFQLSNGLCLPAIGLGTFRIKGQEDIDLAVNSALKEGYKLIDTASVYRNESFIASALKNIDRKSLFITSKLAPKDQGLSKAKIAVEKSLENLQTDYLDLFLIHWPGASGLKVEDPQNSQLRKESWQVLEDFYKKGILKSIGVSNYNIEHLKDLLESCKIKPHVNQIEVHPHYQQKELVDFCVKNDIHVTAYSSLGTTQPANNQKNLLISDPVVAKIAENKNISNAQVLLLWALQKNLSVLPKSTNPEHIRENIDIKSELTVEEIELLDNIETKIKYAWNSELVL